MNIIRFLESILNVSKRIVNIKKEDDSRLFQQKYFYDYFCYIYAN